MTNADKIRQWRDEHLFGTLTEAAFRIILDSDLRGADLYLTVDGAHPYRAELVPTPYGWILTIGCWNGTIDELRALIAQDEGWPEATGEDIEKRRPILEAIADLCDAHIARHADRHVLRLAKRWNS